MAVENKASYLQLFPEICFHEKLPKITVVISYVVIYLEYLILVMPILVMVFQVSRQNLLQNYSWLPQIHMHVYCLNRLCILHQYISSQTQYHAINMTQRNLSGLRSTESLKESYLAFSNLVKSRSRQVSRVLRLVFSFEIIWQVSAAEPSRKISFQGRSDRFHCIISLSTHIKHFII